MIDGVKQSSQHGSVEMSQKQFFPSSSPRSKEGTEASTETSSATVCIGVKKRDTELRLFHRDDIKLFKCCSNRLVALYTDGSSEIRKVEILNSGSLYPRLLDALCMALVELLIGEYHNQIFNSD